VDGNRDFLYATGRWVMQQNTFRDVAPSCLLEYREDLRPELADLGQRHLRLTVLVAETRSITIVTTGCLRECETEDGGQGHRTSRQYQAVLVVDARRSASLP
jgi:hypothetical protein